MASFLEELRRRATADAEAGGRQTDTQTFLNAIDRLIANPNLTIQQLRGKTEVTVFKGQLVRGMREVNKSAAGLLATPVPK